ACWSRLASFGFAGYAVARRTISSRWLGVKVLPDCASAVETKTKMTARMLMTRRRTRPPRQKISFGLTMANIISPRDYRWLRFLNPRELRKGIEVGIAGE